MDDHRPPSSRSHYAHRGATPRACGPFPRLLWGLLMIRPGISSTDTTSTICAATQVVCNSEHVGTAHIARGDLPDGTLFAHVDCRRGPTR